MLNSAPIDPDLQLSNLRELKQVAKNLSDSILDDLMPFVHLKDKQTFVRLPTSKHRNNDVGVTVTCSCLMGIAMTDRLPEFVEKQKAKKWNPKKTFDLVVGTPRWTSSGLVNMNAFTSALVLRTFGMLVEKGVLNRNDAKILIHNGVKEKRIEASDGTFKAVQFPGTGTKWTLRDIFKDLATNPLEKLKVEMYPVSSAVLYWYLDAIDRSGLVRTLGDGFWEEIADWAAREFWNQVSLLTARNDVLMDPIAMAMAACVCKKLKSLAEKLKNNGKKGRGSYLNKLPTELELESSLKLLFACQGSSGIWPKYFPLFHYPDAGGNFCFTFEMLEAVLNEFGKDDARILEIEGAFESFSKAVNWCTQNRFVFQFKGQPYSGWNSGGQPLSLTSGKPESWATAVVHMFLWELETVLSKKIEQKLLTIYRAKRNTCQLNALKGFLDIDILIRNRPASLTKLLSKHVIGPALKDEANLRKNGLKSGKVSALLFGPPGTSKTELCHAIAKRLGWPLVELDPSHFLKGGLEAISIHADKIFNDLMDLNGAVVLFDEMDALVQARDTEDWHLDTASQLLTTSMLPKLAKLHDRKRVIFFMATNFQNRFDPAIKRAGRFDLLLCMGPPMLESKLSSFKTFCKNPVDVENANKISELLRKYVGKDEELAQMLELFTFGEIKAFFSQLASNGPLFEYIKRLGRSAFKELVRKESEFNTLRLKDLSELPKELRGKAPQELEKDANMNFDFLKDQLKFPIVRYLVDKRQSKIQA